MFYSDEKRRAKKINLNYYRYNHPGISAEDTISAPLRHESLTPLALSHDFFALRDIKLGEELTVNYETYNGPKSPKYI